MQLNRLLYTLMLFLVFSCKGEAQKSNKTNKTDTYSTALSQVDFLNPKYSNGYRLNIDGSDKSDHPFYSYVDCKNEGYFAVHYVPKSELLRKYWSDDFFGENKYEYDDAETENKIISDKISKKLGDYNVFSYLVDSQNINQSNNCNEESISLKKNAKAKIYLLDQKTNKWTFLKEIKADLLPPFVNDDFFISNFSHLFSSETQKSSENSNSYVLDSAELNSNQNNYKVVVLEDIKKKNQENPQHNSLPVIIKKESRNGYQDFLKNDKLIFKYNDNCPADGFQKLVSKNNFFTIEQTYCKDFMFVQSYITFKITESQEILLYKYGEEYTDRSNPDKEIKSLLKTTKDFGVVKFENVTDDLLIRLSNEN